MILKHFLFHCRQSARSPSTQLVHRSCLEALSVSALCALPYSLYIVFGLIICKMLSLMNAVRCRNQVSNKNNSSCSISLLFTCI